MLQSKIHLKYLKNMAQLTRAQLKALWITNYVPTQQDFADFFDSYFNNTDDSSSLELTANKSNDIATDASSTTKYPSVKAIKDYADGLVIGLWDDRGDFDASINTFPTLGGSGNSGAILKGDLWTISVIATSGALLGYAVGTIVRALSDSPGQTVSSWAITAVGIGYVPENNANKVTSISGSSTDIQYPSAKLVYDQLAGKQSTGSYELATNKDASNGYAGLTLFAHNFWNAAKSFLTTVVGTATQTRTQSLQDKDGVIALTSDVAAYGLFDATIGTGGDYADIAAAQTANKYRLKAVGNITMSGATTISNSIYLDLSGYTMDCGAYKFTKSGTVSLTITDSKNAGTLTYAYASVLVLFNSFDNSNLFISNITIINNSTIDLAGLGIYGNYDNVIFSVTTTKDGSIAFNFVGNISKSTVIGASAISLYCSKGSICKDIRVQGTGAGLVFYACENIIIETSGLSYIYCFSGKNIISPTNKLYLTVYSSLTVNGIIDQSLIDATIQFPIYGKIINSTFLNNVSIYDDILKYIYIDNCYFYGTVTGLGPYGLSVFISISNSEFRAAVSIVDSVIRLGSGLYNCRFMSTLTIGQKNMTINGIFEDNVSLTGAADGTKLTGILASGKTITLASGVENCYILVGVPTADNVDGTNDSIVDNSGNTNNRIQTYKITA